MRMSALSSCVGSAQPVAFSSKAIYSSDALGDHGELRVNEIAHSVECNDLRERHCTGEDLGALEVLIGV